MAEFKIDYKLTGPQMYEDGRKLMKDSTLPDTIKIEGSDLSDAKKKASSIIKNSKKYSDFRDRFHTEAPKPRIQFLKPLADRMVKHMARIKAHFKIAGKGGSGSQQYEGTKEILPKPSVVIDRLKKQSGGRVDKALSGRNRYI